MKNRLSEFKDNMVCRHCDKGEDETQEDIEQQRKTNILEKTSSKSGRLGQKG